MKNATAEIVDSRGTPIMTRYLFGEVTPERLERETRDFKHRCDQLRK